MKHHGGVHEWDLTKAEARGVVRVSSRRVCESIHMLIQHTVVQHSIDYLRSSHRLHQSFNSASLSQNILTSKEKSL